MTAAPLSYQWDVQGNGIKHWVKGATYTGEFSEDGTTIMGGWRPDEGVEANAGNAYDVAMTAISTRLARRQRENQYESEQHTDAPGAHALGDTPALAIYARHAGGPVQGVAGAGAAGQIRREAKRRAA